MNFDSIKASHDVVDHEVHCENRKIYIAMSAMTKGGRVPSYREVLDHLSRNSNPSPKGASDEAST